MKFLNSVKGFSLVEIMIAVSILSIILLGMMNLTTDMTKQQKTMSQLTDANAVFADIGRILANKDNCSVTVDGASSAVDPNPSAPNAGTPIPQIKILGFANKMKASRYTKVVDIDHPEDYEYVAKGFLINELRF